jgi:hypothetical protein
MTPIADMVEQMLSGGIPPETIVLAVRAAELAVQQNTRASLPADTAAARRRAWDRDRKRKSKSGIPPESENGSLIASSPSEEAIEVVKEESKKDARASTGIPPEFHRKKKRVGPMPENWSPPQRAFNLAVSLGLRVEDIEPRYRDYLASSGKQYADYDAGFCNFIRNTPKFSGGKNGSTTGNILPAFDSLIDRVRDFDRMPGVRGIESKTPVRLLPEG